MQFPALLLLLRTDSRPLVPDLGVINFHNKFGKDPSKEIY